MNLIEFKPVLYGGNLQPCKEEDKINQMLEDNNLEPRKIANTIKFNNWAIIYELLQLFCYDQDLLLNIQMAVYPQVSQRAIDFLNDEMTTSS